MFVAPVRSSMGCGASTPDPKTVPFLSLSSSDLDDAATLSQLALEDDKRYSLVRVVQQGSRSSLQLATDNKSGKQPKVPWSA